MIGLATIIAFSGRAAAAQSPASPLDRIWRIGMDSSDVQPLAHTLFDSIGPRLTGSPALRSASDWIIAKYRSWGIDARRENYGTWRGWRRGASHIDLVSPRVRSLEGAMLAWSPGTGGRALSAPVIILPAFTDSAEFVKWLPRARGKIVLLSPAWPTCRPSENWYRHATPAAMAQMDTIIGRVQQDWSVRTTPNGLPDSAKLYRGTGYSLGPRGTGTLGMRLDKAGVGAMVISAPRMSDFPNPFAQSTGDNNRSTMYPGSDSGGGGPGQKITAGGVSAEPGTGGWGTYEVYETYNARAPAVALSCEDYGLLFRLAEGGDQPTLRLDLDATALGDVPTFNTIGVIKGSEKPDEYVILSAHLDSWDGGSGATDNGSGTLMAMEAMRILSLAYPHPKRTIIAGHWSAEEEGVFGSGAWSEDHPEVMKGLQAVFNQDNGPGRIQTIWSTGLLDMPRHLKAWYAALPPYFTDSTSPNVVQWMFENGPVARNFSTDAAVFACKGAPAFRLQGALWGYFTYMWHSNRDTYDKLVFDDLKSNATLAAMLVYLAAEDPELIARTRSPVEWPSDCGTAPRKTHQRL